VSVACTPPAPGSAAARAGRYSCRALRSGASVPGCLSSKRRHSDCCRLAPEQTPVLCALQLARRLVHVQTGAAGQECDRTGSPSGSRCCALQHSQTQKWVTACRPRAAAQPTLGCSACRATTCVQESASDSASRNTQSPLAAPARRPALLSGAPVAPEGASSVRKAAQLELGCWRATHTCSHAATPAAVCSLQQHSGTTLHPSVTVASVRRTSMLHSTSY